MFRKLEDIKLKPFQEAIFQMFTLLIQQMAQSNGGIPKMKMCHSIRLKSKRDYLIDGKEVILWLASQRGVAGMS